MRRLRFWFARRIVCPLRGHVVSAAQYAGGGRCARFELCTRCGFGTEARKPPRMDIPRTR